MSGQTAAKPEYGNWVSKRLTYMSGFVGFVFLVLSLIFWVLASPAVLFLLVSAYFFMLGTNFLLKEGTCKTESGN
jgi:hypothetical protein